MFEFIPSESCRNYCIKNGITFSDRERAAIIINLGMFPREKKFAELEKIASETADRELKNDIENFIRERRAAVESVMRKDDGYVYTIKHWGETPVLFYDFETAKNYADHNEKKPYSIQKIRITPQNDKPASHDLFGFLSFDPSGEFKGVWTDKHVHFKGLSDSVIPIVNPFERGDIVINYGTKELGIVETPQEEWRSRIGAAERAVLYGVETSNITVGSFSPYIGYNCGGICPVFLEKVENFDENDPEMQLLLAAGTLLRGEYDRSRSLSKLFSLYDAFRKNNSGDNVFFGEEDEDSN